MDEVVEQVSPTEADEIASAMAGYSKKDARAEEAPAKVEPTEEPEQKETESPAGPTVAEELSALKAKVHSMSGNPEEVRRLHGSIGEINRSLKALQAKPEAAPVDDELIAALKDAEASAAEFPELAGPLVKTIKLLMSRKAPEREPEDIDARVTAAIESGRYKDAVEEVSEAHPDYITVRETPQYQAWLASKTPEFQAKFTTSRKSAVVINGLNEFKDSLKVREKKQQRLAAAVSPQGVAQPARQSMLSDEEAALIGYNKGPKRLTMR